MKVIRQGTLLILIIVSLVLVTGTPARADAQQPTYVVGDHWNYAATATVSASLSLSLTYNLAIVDQETVTIGGNTYDVYRTTLSGTGTATGPTVTAVVTQSGVSFLRRSDLGDVQDKFTTSFTANGQTFTQIQTTTNNPPSVNPQFPLSVSKSWSATIVSQTNQTSIPPSGPPTVTVFSNTTTTTYVVTSTQLTTVTAGTFDTYLVRSSSSAGTDENYYSPEVTEIVKGIHYNSTGAITQTITLQSYDAWPYSASFSASASGNSYSLVFKTDVSATGISQTPTVVSFQVSGTDGVTGRANVTIPIQFNSTAIKVKVDNSTTTATVLKDSVNYYVFFTFPLSTHTISLTYANPPGLPIVLILEIVGAVAAVVIIATIFLLFRRKKPLAIPPPVPGAQPPPMPPPSPSEPQTTESSS